MKERDFGGFQCPYCGEICKGRISDSRRTAYGKRRRRECDKCGKKFTTVEFTINKPSEVYQMFLKNWRL